MKLWCGRVSLGPCKERGRHDTDSKGNAWGEHVWARSKAEARQILSAYWLCDPDETVVRRTRMLFNPSHLTNPKRPQVFRPMFGGGVFPYASQEVQA